jgi:hypothetical protein
LHIHEKMIHSVEQLFVRFSNTCSHLFCGKRKWQRNNCLCSNWGAKWKKRDLLEFLSLDFLIQKKTIFARSFYDFEKCIKESYAILISNFLTLNKCNKNINWDFWLQKKVSKTDCKHFLLEKSFKMDYKHF